MIVGVDEAGRGPLAGPVVAAAVALTGKEIRGLGDSKTLSSAQRIKLEARILDRCLYGIGIASVEEVDTINIFQATMVAMTRAVMALCEQAGAEPSHILIDGNMTPLGRAAQWRWTQCEAIVKGDAKERCISAASILAKEARDRMMRDYCALYPGYGFSQHKGYGTPAHMRALRELGPSPIHRKSFGPVAQLEFF